METVTLKVGGMTRLACANSVKRVLEAVAGVKAAEVSLYKAEAAVRYDTGSTDVARFKGAIEDAGYEVA